MTCCKEPTIKDLTQGLGPDRHLYCEKCKSHEWRGREYSKKEWEEWTEAVAQKHKQMELFS